MSGYYNRAGQEITVEEWAKRFETDDRVVCQQELENGIYVSTVFLGINHAFGKNERPLIFETLVFPSKGDYHDIDGARYSTEEEARLGHDEFVVKHSLT